MDFYEAVEKENLFFPPHPGDESAGIGGVIATNAGGSRAVKYGVVRNFVKGLETVHQLSREYNMRLPTFGHAADGNVHTLPLRAHYLDGKWKEIPGSQWKKIYPQVRKALHDDARKRGGLVSGEHGIGLVKKEYLANAVGENVVEKMRLIKKAFDPNNILNPGKVF